jgi:hypothetical protein
VNASAEAPVLPAASAAVAEASPSLLSRLWEWFWSSRALAQFKARQPAHSERALEFVRRARSAVELGQIAVEPAQPFEHGPMDALACELFRQSIYWALASDRARSGSDGPEPEFSELWLGADGEKLSRVAGGPTLRDAVGEAIGGRSFADFAELPKEEQARLARILGPFAAALCDEAETVRRETERVWRARSIKLGVVVALFVALAAGARVGLERAENARDLAAGKPWTASSKYPEGGCQSPLQSCPGESRYFFCTGEQDNPWVEFDLGSPKAFSAVRVRKREDCCAERAVPLVIEVGNDKKKWTEVAKRTSNFSEWKATFPKTTARYVRLRAPRRTFLHLTSVRILP